MVTTVNPQKKKALFVALVTSAVLILVFSISSNVVRAEDTAQVDVNATSSTDVKVRPKPFINPLGPRSTTTKEQIEERREERKETIASTTAERREKIAEAAKERAKAYLAKIVRRLSAAVLRFEKLAERIEARIEKLEDMGVDMTKAKELLAKAEVEIAEADAAVLALKASIDITISADRPGEIFKEVKEKIRLAIEAIKEAHAALVATIREVKAAGGAKANADAASVDANASVDMNVQVNP